MTQAIHAVHAHWLCILPLWCLQESKTPLPLLLPSPRARDPTSPQCSTPAPISGAGLQEWVGPHDRTGRVVMAVEGVEAAAWGACHGVSPSSHQERLQEIPPPNLVRPLPPCQGHRPQGSSTLRGLGTTLLHKVQNMCAPPREVVYACTKVMLMGFRAAAISVRARRFDRESLLRLLMELMEHFRSSTILLALRLLLHVNLPTSL